MELPVRSPDLTPLDYFFLGIQPENFKVLQLKKSETDVIDNLQHEFTHGLSYCQIITGTAQFEHLL